MPRGGFREYTRGFGEASVGLMVGFGEAAEMRRGGVVGVGKALGGDSGRLREDFGYASGMQYGKPPIGFGEASVGASGMFLDRLDVSGRLWMSM